MNQLTNYWLSILCTLVKGATRAVVFSAVADEESYQATAYWPANKSDDMQYLSPAIQAALSKNQCVLLQKKKTGQDTGEPYDLIACPMILGEQINGVIVVQTCSSVSTIQQSTMRQVEEATVWFEAIINQCSSTEKHQLVTIVELVASCLEHEQFQAAATDVMTDLTSRLSCDRISIGFLHGNNIEVAAVSHSAGFDSKSSVIRDIGEAMQEAMNQDCTIIYPQSSDAVLLTRCHAAFIKEHGAGMLVTVPFVVNGKISGAVLAERSTDRPFDQKTVEHLEQIVSMIGPVLEVRQRDEQWLPQKINNSCKRLFRKLFGPGHIGLKFSLAAVALCLALLTFTTGDYRVTGIAKLEAMTQRVIVAPQDGFIAQANVRPGDIIHSGDNLAALDDKDLQLESRKWSSQLEQLQTEYRDALAKHDRSKVSIINAKRLQALAQLNLVNEQLSRTRFTAPFDGLIVSGDLSQALGSPVERGQVLFTVAPLDAYRVILKVDERDIGNIKIGQRGNMVLSGMARKPFLFTVEKITPVSITEDGRNYFQVEAKMEQNFDLLRPGMEGVAKIDIDQRKLIWIWTHKLVDWLRLFLWTWRP